MRVSVLQENLAKYLSIVSRVVASRPAQPILSNVLLATEDGRFKLAATNFEAGIIARIGAKVDEDGAIAVPARTLLDLVNTFPPERVDLELDARTQTLMVRCGTDIANIRGIDAEQFPPMGESEADTGLELPAAAFQAMIDQVVFSAAKEDNRPILMGVLMRLEDSKMTLIASDGFRMALRSITLETTAEKPLSLVVPARTLIELSRIIGSDEGTVLVSVPPGRNQVMFHLSDIDVISQLIDGKFPDVEALIPKSISTTSTLDTRSFLLACKRAEIFAHDDNNKTRIRVKPGEGSSGQVIVTSLAQEKGDNENTLEAAVNGPGLEVSFNVRYLIDVLSVMDADQVVIETNTASSPGVIKPSGRQDYIYVVMPMSVR